MTRTTVAMARASRIPEALNIAPTDVRFLEFLNEAQNRLLYRGKYWGTYGRWRFPVTSRYLTLPPQVDTIEAVAVSSVPLPLRDSFAMFLENGNGIRDGIYGSGCDMSEVLHLGNYPTLVDFDATPGIITAKCDRASDVGKLVLFLGLDDQGNIIRTLQNGSIADGEVVVLTQGGGTNSVTQFRRITDIQAPPNLDGQWWTYLGGITGTLIGHYQWFDINPSWKRYLIPFVNTTTTVDAMCKHAFFPVKNDNDYLIIGNLAALKLACMAVQAEENHSWAEAQLLWNGGKDSSGIQRIGAIQELNFELDHQLGDGRQVGITVVGSNIGANDPVQNLL